MVQTTSQYFLCRDPEDNKFLDLAAQGFADCVISSDDDLLVLHPFGNIEILTTNAFLEANFL